MPDGMIDSKEIAVLDQIAASLKIKGEAKVQNVTVLGSEAQIK